MGGGGRGQKLPVPNMHIEVKVQTHYHPLHKSSLEGAGFKRSQSATHPLPAHKGGLERKGLTDSVARMAETSR